MYYVLDLNWKERARWWCWLCRFSFPDPMFTLYHYLLSLSPSLFYPSSRLIFMVETLGFVVLESMASGVPVIGCAAGGIPDLIRHGDTGFLVPPGDIDAYTACAQQLMNDKSFRIEMGKRARTEAELWGWEAATSVLRNVQYEKAMINFHSRAFGGFGNKKSSIASSTVRSVWSSIRMKIGQVLGKLRFPGFRRRNVEEEAEGLMYYI